MYTADDYQTLITQLKGLADEKYSKFHSNLVPGVREEKKVLGISVPKLRAVAKELVKNCDDIDGYLLYSTGRYYEELMLKGIVIGYVKCSWKKRLEYIKDFVPQISDWAVCDIFCGGIKPPKEEIVSFRKFVATYLESDKEFEIRFAVVILLQKYICEEYITSTLQALKNIGDNRYYVQMAVAWAISVCYVKFPERTLELFKEKSLAKEVHNKAIQKCRESRRVSDVDKTMLLKYKM